MNAAPTVDVAAVGVAGVPKDYPDAEVENVSVEGPPGPTSTWTGFGAGQLPPGPRRDSPGAATTAPGQNPPGPGVPVIPGHDLLENRPPTPRVPPTPTAVTATL